MSQPTFYRLPNVDPTPALGGVLGGVIALVGGVLLLTSWAATQYAAYRLGFHPALGIPLLAVSAPSRSFLGPSAVVAGGLGAVCLGFRQSRIAGALLLALSGALLALLVGPLYAPFNFFVWWWRFRQVPGTASLWSVGLWAVSLSSYTAAVLTILMAVRRRRQLGAKADTHGSARWATAADLRRAEILGRDAGVYVGAWSDGRTLRYLRHDGPQHVMAFAPSRSGKGVGLVLPTLLSWPGSTVVNDIKGENWALTAGWRKEALGSHCLKFDPTAADGSTARYNPLLEVRPWPRDVRDAQLIADMLIDPDGQGTRDHWDLTAHDLLVGVILHVLYAEPDKSLHGCLTLLADPSRAIESTLSVMLRMIHDPDGAIGWQDADGLPTHTHPAVAGAARALLNKSDNERSSVVSSAVKFLNLYRDPVVAANTRVSDFVVQDLVRHARPVSLYLTIPPSDIHRTRPLSRLLLNQIVNRLTETLDVSGGQAVPTHPHRLLLMLDEFPTLGRMEVIQTALAYAAGYGIKAYLIVQDLAQLSQSYGRYESIISNCHVRIAYAANKVETARLISDMVGTMTVHRATRTYTGNRLIPVLPRVTASEQDTARPLLTADEVMRLPAEDALVFVAGHPPIYGKKIRYYADPVFGARAIIPPPASDRFPPEASPWSGRVSRWEAPPIDPAEPTEPQATMRSAHVPAPPASEIDPDRSLA